MTKGAEEWRKHPGKEFKQAAFAMALQQLDSFVNGDELEENIDLKQLHPKTKHVWAIRTVLEEPRIRLFGWFPWPKHFVVVHAKTRPGLDRGNAWDRAIDKVVEARQTLLPGLQPYVGNVFRDYVG